MTVSATAQTKPTYVDSPQVHDDGKVTFRLFAPKAKEVVLSAGANSGAMHKTDQGIWETTIGPLACGTYDYQFNVDGATVLDPVNRNTKAWLWMKSLVDVSVPDQPPAQYQVQNVPHGELHLQFYHSKQLDKPRQFFVYTPPGYGTSETRYPVLYLLHGFGDDESAWWKVGKANNILDNVLAQGDAVPFIVVMPFGHGELPETPDYEIYDLEANTQLLETELLETIKPMVEARYRCLTESKWRGIAGLSMGGGHSVRIGLSHTDLFGWVTGYSASITHHGCQDTIKTHRDAIKKNQPRLSLVCGETDFLFEENVDFQKQLSDLNIQHHHHWSQGGHTWDNWRAYLAITAKTMFSK